MDDIRIFLSNIGKSGITIEQCVQGYRTAQVLKQFGVYDDDESEESIYENEEIKDDARSEKPNLDTFHNKEPIIDLKPPNLNSLFPNSRKENKNSMVKPYQFSYFIEVIYKNCKNHSIKPSIVVRWIEDLFNFYSVSYNQSTDDDSIDKYSNANQKNINEEEFQRSGLDEIYDYEIPFTSKVSDFIKDKKKNIKYLENKRNSISNDIVVLEKQRMERTSELNKVIEKEKKAFSYFKWYDNLRQELLYEYKLIIEQEYGTFADSINDFKRYNFDATRILTEFKHIDSLRKERERVQVQIDQNTSRRNNLLNEISSLEEQGNYYNQTIKTYQQLHNKGFGLKELKQLNNLVKESHSANGLEVNDSIKKFLKDVEDQYDNKLGFEKKIKELKAEMEKLKDEIPGYKSHLTLQANVTPTLIHLTSSGVTNEDIIGMNHLVLEFKNNSDFLSDPINKNNSDYFNSNIKTNNNYMTRTQYWYVFVEKLKELKNINTEINKQVSSLNYLKTQISDLIANKQKIENAYADSVSNLNEIIMKTHQFLDMARQISEPTSKKILPVLIIFPVIVDFDSPHDNDPAENQDSQ